jgi:hypothetical protein
MIVKTDEREREINYPRLAETTNLGPTHGWPMGRKCLKQILRYSEHLRGKCARLRANPAMSFKYEAHINVI